MRTRLWLGFAALCVLGSLRWLLDSVVPPPLPALVRESLHSLLLLAALGSYVGMRRSGTTLAPWGPIALYAALLFAVPGLVLAGAEGHVTGLTEALAAMLGPVVVVGIVAQQSTGFGVYEDPRRLLAPAVAGLAGAWLLLPFTMPPSVVGKLYLALLVASVGLAGLAAVRLHGLLRGVGVVPAGVTVCGAIAAVSGAISVRRMGVLSSLDARAWAVEVGIALLFDGPLLLLTVWLLREMRPVAFSARYGLTLLLTIVTSYVLMRPQTVWSMVAGALLMAGSAAWLMRADSTDTPVE